MQSCFHDHAVVFRAVANVKLEVLSLCIFDGNLMLTSVIVT